MDNRSPIEVVSCLGQSLWVGAPRPGRRRFGVPPGGAWDLTGFEILAQGLGVDHCLEVATTATGEFLRLRALSDSLVCVWGEGMVVRSDRESARTPALAGISAGQTVEVENASGFRALVAAVRVPQVKIGCSRILASMQTPEVIPYFPLEEGLGELTVTVALDSSREGLRLNGGGIYRPALDKSEPSIYGAIQATPSGELLVHGPDGPTVGGYAKIGCFSPVGASCLARLGPGSGMRLIPSLHEASAFELAGREELQRLAKSIARAASLLAG